MINNTIFGWAAILLVCIPMTYQCWLLWIQFQNEVTPFIYYRIEEFSDLPALTVCVPASYTFPSSMIEERIDRATGAENPCFKLKINGFQNGSIPMTSSDLITYLVLRYECHEYGWLQADPNDWISVQDFLRGDSINGSLPLQKFAKLGQRYQSKDIAIEPNVVTYNPDYGLCWTWHSRATADWRAAIATQQPQHQRDGNETNDQLLKNDEGEPVAGEIPGFRVSPKKIHASIPTFYFTFDSAKLLTHHFGQPLADTEPNEWLMNHQDRKIFNADRIKLRNNRFGSEAYEQATREIPVQLILHSPYHVTGYRHPSSSRWYYNIFLIKEMADLLNSSKTSDLSVKNYRYELFYSKTTLRYFLGSAAARRRYSDYSDPELPVYSYDDCRTTQEFLVKFRGCIKLPPDSFNTNLLNTLAGLNSTKYKAVYQCEGESEKSDKNSTQVLGLGPSNNPKSLLLSHNCLLDGTKIVYRFDPMADAKIFQPAIANRREIQQKFHFNFELDPVPELSIRYRAKMSAVEIFANLAGLCGMWLGFSVLNLISLLISFLINKFVVWCGSTNSSKISPKIFKIENRFEIHNRFSSAITRPLATAAAAAAADQLFIVTNHNHPHCAKCNQALDIEPIED